ncbi:hypothetical protein OTU49_007703 [Cherax quadricarinatus]|uniref:Uncharacterized protein n=1 Tax=Cherax quadricarinatus TaxID=27406 RepID=A0AAW0WU48_CHEQU
MLYQAGGLNSGCGDMEGLLSKLESRITNKFSTLAFSVEAQISVPIYFKVVSVNGPGVTDLKFSPNGSVAYFTINAMYGDENIAFTVSRNDLSMNVYWLFNELKAMVSYIDFTGKEVHNLHRVNVVHHATSEDSRASTVFIKHLSHYGI